MYGEISFSSPANWFRNRNKIFFIKFLKLKKLWRFFKLNKLTRFLDEITMFDKTMKIVFFRDGIVLIT